MTCTSGQFIIACTLQLKVVIFNPQLQSTSHSITVILRVISTKMAWHPLTKTSLGSVNFSTPGVTQTYDLTKAGVPSDAREVLIYVVLITGNSKGVDADIEVTLYTTDETGLEYKKYLDGHLYNQDAYTSNTENMFFPIAPGHQTLYAQYSGPSSNYNCNLYVTGYRIGY